MAADPGAVGCVAELYQAAIEASTQIDLDDIAALVGGPRAERGRRPPQLRLGIQETLVQGRPALNAAGWTSSRG